MTSATLPNARFFEACKAATRNALLGKVKDEEVQKLLERMPEHAVLQAMVGVPSPAEAKAELWTVAIYGYVSCTPTSLDHTFEANHWGIGLNASTSYGFMYTAYDSWEGLFTETQGYHAQGIQDAGGILQINWFNGSGTPVGQFNGVAAGLGVFEVGGSGRWKKK